MLVGLLAAAVVCSLWRLWPEADAADVMPLPATPAIAAPPALTPVSWQEAQPHSGAIGRNVFAFEEPRVEPVHTVPAPQPATAVVVQQAPAPVAEIRTPEKPLFPYAYIGRFGPDANPIAVFSRDGEIVNARVGEIIGGAWLLKEIGMESVVVNDQRIGLATSS